MGRGGLPEFAWDGHRLATIRSLCKESREIDPDLRLGLNEREKLRFLARCVSYHCETFFFPKLNGKTESRDDFKRLRFQLPK